MKECLYCKKEFEAKTDKRKFCSDSCRVMHHRKFGKNSEVKPFQVQALFNQMMEFFAENKSVPQVPISQPTHLYVPKNEHITIETANKNWQYYMNRIPEIRDLDGCYKLDTEIKNSSLLPNEKKILLENLVKHSRTFYND